MMTVVSRGKRVRAFTLLELLIVVAIISILAVIAIPNLMQARVRSKISKAKQELKTIAVADRKSVV